jgi:hypothetical protein
VSVYRFDSDEPAQAREQLAAQEREQLAVEGQYRWPLDWRPLCPPDRWLWFQHLWVSVCELRERYCLPVRSRWWADDVQVEALAALAAWTERYDSGEWDDPPGKLSLLFDLERISSLLRDGNEPFHPERDRQTFAADLIERGCQPPTSSVDIGAE